MRLILTLILCLPLAAQLDIPLMSKRPGLTRSRMAAGVNVTGGVDTQSIASIPPGTATLVRGATSGSSTDDPVVSNSGWTLDSGDRISGLPAKGAAWTTTNCSGVECYTVTSAGTEYVNGVARRNLLRWSEDRSNAYWSKDNATVSGTRITLSGTNPSRLFGAVTVAAGANTVVIRAKSYSGVNQTFYVRLFDGTAATWTNALTATAEYQNFTLTRTCTAGTGNVLIAGSTDVNAAADLDVQYIQVNPGSTALEYQKTTDSREWALETPGNYVGLLTGFYRWDRVLGPGEVLNSHRGYIRPTLNAKGNTIQ